MDNSFDLKRILGSYSLPGSLVECEPVTNGHINDTYLLRFDEGGAEKRYILQRVNTSVFRLPDLLMENYVKVTEFLREKVRAAGGDVDREALRVYPTADSSYYVTDPSGGCWRIISYITDAYSCNEITDLDVCRKAGKAFGRFLELLDDYPGSTLHETIPDFHNTVKRYENFEAAVARNASGRLGDCAAEVDFAKKRKDDCGVLLDCVAAGEIPVRVTHNDTKLNNVLFDNAGGEGICVIDLDTVMPGLSLYDFGDSLRFAGNTAAEDEKDISKVSFSLDIYRAFTEGYLSAAASSLTEKEIYYLPFSCKLMTFECGMRFLTDYLDGDVYFKTAYPEHNLVRCRTQFRLVEDIERQYDELMDITGKIYRQIISGGECLA